MIHYSCIHGAPDRRRPCAYLRTFPLDRALEKATRFTVQLYNSELGQWVDLGARERAQLERVAIAIEGHGLRIAQLREAG